MLKTLDGMIDDFVTGLQGTALQEEQAHQEEVLNLLDPLYEVFLQESLLPCHRCRPGPCLWRSEHTPRFHTLSIHWFIVNPLPLLLRSRAPALCPMLFLF